MALVIYSWAGEKMPWLIVHIALPLLLLAARYLGELFTSATRNAWEKRIAFGGAAVLALWTVHTGWPVNFERPDTPRDLLVYTQTAPDVKQVMGDLERLSLQQTGDSRGLGVVVQSGTWWPFSWYLRDWKNAEYPAQLTAPPDQAGGADRRRGRRQEPALPLRLQPHALQDALVVPRGLPHHPGGHRQLRGAPALHHAPGRPRRAVEVAHLPRADAAPRLLRLLPLHQGRADPQRGRPGRGRRRCPRASSPASPARPRASARAGSKRQAGPGAGPGRPGRGRPRQAGRRPRPQAPVRADPEQYAARTVAVVPLVQFGATGRGAGQLNTPRGPGPGLPGQRLRGRLPEPPHPEVRPHRQAAHRLGHRGHRRRPVQGADGGGRRRPGQHLRRRHLEPPHPEARPQRQVRRQVERPERGLLGPAGDRGRTARATSTSPTPGTSASRSSTTAGGSWPRWGARGPGRAS